MALKVRKSYENMAPVLMTLHMCSIVMSHVMSQIRSVITRDASYFIQRQALSLDLTSQLSLRVDTLGT